MKSKLSALVFIFTFLCKFGIADANQDLTKACVEGDLEGVKKAISNGANVNALDANGNTAIGSAFFWPDIVKYLLDNKTNPNLGNTPVLFQASFYCSSEVMKLVLDAGADPNKPLISDPSVTFKTLIETEKIKERTRIKV